MLPDARHLLAALRAPGLTWHELSAAPRARRPAARAGPLLLALVSFEPGLGRTTVARRLIRAFARRGTRATRIEAAPREDDPRTDVLVVDEPGPPSSSLLAEADEVVVLVRPSLSAVRAAEAALAQRTSWRRPLPRYLVCRFDARTDLAALADIRGLVGKRLLLTTIHDDPFLDEKGSQVEADVAALARELHRKGGR